MWLIFKSFVSTNAVKLAGILASIIALLGAVAAIWQAGKNSARTDELQNKLKQGEKAHGIEDNNRAELHDGDALKRLRDKWSR